MGGGASPVGSEAVLGDAMAGPLLLLSGWSAPGPALPEGCCSPDADPPGARWDKPSQSPVSFSFEARLIEGAKEPELSLPNKWKI